MNGVLHISENQSLSLFFVFPLVLLSVHHQPQILLITTKTSEELHTVAENNMKYKAAVTANIHWSLQYTVLWKRIACTVLEKCCVVHCTMLCSVKQQPVNYECRCTVQLGIYTVYYTVQCCAVQQYRAVQQSVNWDCHWSLTTKLQSLQCATWWWSSSSFYWHHELRHGGTMMALRYLLRQNSEDFLCLSLPAASQSCYREFVSKTFVFLSFCFLLVTSKLLQQKWPTFALTKKSAE